MSGHVVCEHCLKSVKATPGGSPKRHRADRIVDGVEVVAPCPGGRERIEVEST